MNERYVCIHGHFYQPPRENPWLETVEIQDSAAPYHDWNARVTAECYAPNAAARMLDDHGRIERIVNNYERISFNFGPTLLEWLEEHDAETYGAVLEADRRSRERFSGHGSAMAQAYNHMILPLASSRDKRTQILWGIADFRRRFGRDPEGMWLAETAVDGETLDLMAEAGVRFTVLAPGQARSWRAPGEAVWTEADGGIDPHRPYRVPLPSGRSIAVFFYHGPVASAVAFERLLQRGDHLAARLLEALGKGPGPRLAHIATDGETYGHHHQFGEMALARALHLVETGDRARLTNYGAFLEKFPPDFEAQIVEDSSWSCAHGVERWRNDCGCRTGGEAHFIQAWRAGLRDALDWLRDRLGERFENAGAPLLPDPWAARDAYIDVVLDRSPENAKRYLDANARPGLDAAETTRALELLEMQRHAMLMYTSCGWFFNELSGIETVQVLQYAARALELGERFGDALEPGFLSRLEAAHSNLPAKGNGRDVYDRLVRPARVDLRRVAVHHAVRSPFEPPDWESRVFAFRIREDDVTVDPAGAGPVEPSLRTGRVEVVSSITREHAAYSFVVLHLGDHDLTAGVAPYGDAPSHAAVRESARRAFAEPDFDAVRRVLAEKCGPVVSFESLFLDERREILDRVMETSLVRAEDAYQKLYDEHRVLIRYLARVDAPQPDALRYVALVVLGRTLRRELESDALDVDRIRDLLAEAAEVGLDLNPEIYGYAYRETLERALELLVQGPADLEILERVERGARLVEDLPFPVSLWRAQNLFAGLQEAVSPEAVSPEAAGGGDAGPRWRERFASLGRALSFRMD